MPRVGIEGGYISSFHGFGPSAAEVLPSEKIRRRQKTGDLRKLAEREDSPATVAALRRVAEATITLDLSFTRNSEITVNLHILIEKETVATMQHHF